MKPAIGEGEPVARKLVLTPTSLRRRSKREAIKKQLVRWIAEQGLEPGARMKSQNELAAHFNVTAVTVFKALRELAERGVVYRRFGSGTYVGPPPDDTRRKSLCWVLPGEHLESPDYNPIWWPYIQQWYREFLGAAGDQWSFVTRSVRPQAVPGEVATELAGYDVVFFHHSKEPQELFRYLVANEIVPVVAFGLPVGDVPCLTIDHDIGAGMDMAVEHLAKLGHRRIALMVTAKPWSKPWTAGFRTALQEHNLAGDQELIVRVGIPQDAAANGADWLIKNNFPCTAMICDSDLHGAGLVDALRQRGVDVPSQISVMGYDGLDYALQHPPFLTSLQVPYRKMIQAGLEQVVKAPCRPTPKKHLALVGTIFPGTTCAPPPPL